MILLNSINPLVFVMDMPTVFCEVGTESTNTSDSVWPSECLNFRVAPVGYREETIAYVGHPGRSCYQ